MDYAAERSSSAPAVLSDRPIFISYARDDDEAFVMRLRDDLVSHGHEVWWDRASMESRGRSFLAEIRAAIESAERVLLVVGPAVTERPYVEVEWRHALRHGVVVTPILRRGEYSDIPTALAALHCEDVRDHLPEEQALASVRRIAGWPVPPRGPLLGVPRLPSPFVARPDLLDRLLGRVLIDAHEPIDLEADQRITGLTGMGGVGKSVLATALAQTAEVRRSFQGGVVWTTVGQHADIVTTLSRVGRALGEDVTNYTDLDSARILLSRALLQASCLLVLDDVWDSKIVEALHLAAGAGVRILMTSRHQNLFASTGVQRVMVEELSEEQGLELLAHWTSTPLGELPQQAREVSAECGNLPLALSMVGAMIGSRPDRWDYALERLRRADLTKIGAPIPNYPYGDLDRAMLVSFEDLEAQLQQRYLDLAVLPEDASAPIRMLQRWWMAEGADSLDVVETMDRLADRSLVRVQADGRYAVHDVQRDFLLARAGNNAKALHERWLTAFRPPDSNAWWSAPDDGYLLDHLEHHLREAGHGDEWRWLLTSFEWLDRKTLERGFPEVLQDLLHEVGQDSIRRVERAGRSAAHVLANDPAQLAAQLRARLNSQSGDATIDRLRAAARTVPSQGWLCPLNSALNSDGDPLSIAFRGRELDGHAGTPRSIALSSELSLVASGGGSSNDLTVKLWSRLGATLLWTVDDVMMAGGQAPLAFIAADGRLAVAGDDHVSIHTPARAEADTTMRFAGRSVSDICKGHKDGVVIVAFRDGGILRWNSSDASTATLREPDGEVITAVAHAAAAPRLIIATASHVECRQSDDGTLVGQIDQRIDVYSRPGPLLTVDETGSRAWFGSPAVEWSIEEGTSSSFLLGAGTVVAVTPNGRTALAIPDDDSYNQQDLLVLDVQTAVPRGRIRNSREFSCLALADTGDLVVTADYEHDVKVWDLTRATMDLADWAVRGPVERTSICENGGLALVVSAHAREVWDTTIGRVVDRDQDVGLTRRLVRHGAVLRDAVLDARLRKKMEAVLNRVPDDPLERGMEQRGIGPVAVSRAARRAVMAPLLPGKMGDVEEPVDRDPREPSRLWIWDLDDLSAARRVREPTGWITSLSITGDGRFALAGSQGRLLRLWDLETGNCLRSLRGHRGMVYSCGISDDARYAVSGSEDMTVRLWDLQAGVLLFTFATASAVTCCDIAADAKAAIAGEVSGRVHVFEVR